MSDHLEYSGNPSYSFASENSGSGIGADFWTIRAAHGWHRPETRKPRRDTNFDTLLPVIPAKSVAGRVQHECICIESTVKTGTCPQCLKTFIQPPRTQGSHGRKYCGEVCSEAAHNAQRCASDAHRRKERHALDVL